MDACACAPTKSCNVSYTKLDTPRKNRRLSFPAQHDPETKRRHTMTLAKNEKPYRHIFQKPIILPADREQGYGESVIPGYDPNAGVRPERTADQSADDHAVGDPITVKGKRTSIRAGTRFGG